MKKKAIIVLALMLAFSSVTGCKKKEEVTPADTSSTSSQAAPASPYLDGDYEATFKVPAVDRTIDSIKVTVANGAFEIKEYTCKEESGADDTASAAATDAEINARKEMDAILDSYDKANGVLEDMEAIEDEGMEHFYRFQRMMREIVAASEKGRTTKMYLNRFADGDYTVTAKSPDGDGYTNYIKASVLNGELSSVQFDGEKGGAMLSADTTEDGKAKYDIYSQIAESFSDSGDPTALVMPENGQDATSAFVRLATPLVSSMTSGGQLDFVAPTYIDGTYVAQFADFDENGWKEIVVLNIHNDVIAVRSFDAMSKADQNVLRSTQTELDDKMKAATGTYTFSEAVLMLAEGFSKSNNDVFAVDNVSGATVTSNNFKQLVNAILTTTALNGDLGEPLEIERVTSEKAE